MDDSGIIWTLVLGAVGGFAGGWFQSWLRRDEERLRLHREKLEALLSDVNEWSAATYDFLFGWGMNTLDLERWEGIYSRIKISRMDVLFRFYAGGIWSQYNRCWKNWYGITMALKKKINSKSNLCSMSSLTT